MTPSRGTRAYATTIPGAEKDASPAALPSTVAASAPPRVSAPARAATRAWSARCAPASDAAKNASASRRVMTTFSLEFSSESASNATSVRAARSETATGGTSAPGGGDATRMGCVSGNSAKAFESADTARVACPPPTSRRNEPVSTCISMEASANASSRSARDASVNRGSVSVFGSDGPLGVATRPLCPFRVPSLPRTRAKARRASVFASRSTPRDTPEGEKWREDALRVTRSSCPSPSRRATRRHAARSPFFSRRKPSVS